MPAGRKNDKIAIVYTLKGCPYCVKAVKHLRAKKYTVKTKGIARGDQPLELPDGRKSGYTYPQVFILIGGYDDTVRKLP